MKRDFKIWKMEDVEFNEEEEEEGGEERKLRIDQGKISQFIGAVSPQ